MKITVSLQLSPQDPENALAEGNGNSKDDADETRDGAPKNDDGVDGEVAESTEVDMSKATESLRIDGFIRPLPTKALQELLGKYETVMHFWLQGVKKYCLVTYENKEQAAAALTGIDGISWPEDSRPKLTVSFIAPQEVQEALATKSNTKTNNSKESRPTKALDELFRRTKAKPAIYWLPLTEEDIAKKEKEAKKRSDQKDRSTKSDKSGNNNKENRIRREDGREKESTNDSRSSGAPRGGGKRRRSESPAHSNKKPNSISQPKETKRQAPLGGNKKTIDTVKNEPTEAHSNNKKRSKSPSSDKNTKTAKPKTKKAASSSPSKSKSSSPDRSKSKKSR